MDNITQEQAEQEARRHGREAGIRFASHNPDATLDELIEAEDNARQFTPFEFLAHELNQAPHPSEAWDAYDSAFVEYAERELAR